MSFWMLEGKHHPLTPIIPLKKLKEGVEAGSFEQLVSKSWEMFHFITLSLPLMLELFATTESNRMLSGSMYVFKRFEIATYRKTKILIAENASQVRDYLILNVISL